MPSRLLSYWGSKRLQQIKTEFRISWKHQIASINIGHCDFTFRLSHAILFSTLRNQMRKGDKMSRGSTAKTKLNSFVYIPFILSPPVGNFDGCGEMGSKILGKEKAGVL